MTTAYHTIGRMAVFALIVMGLFFFGCTTKKSSTTLNPALSRAAAPATTPALLSPSASTIGAVAGSTYSSSSNADDSGYAVVSERTEVFTEEQASVGGV